MKKLIIPIIGIVVAVGIFMFIPKETHQESTQIATTEVPTTAIPETTEETTTAPETTIAPTTEVETTASETTPETLNEIQLIYISMLDDTITLYTLGDITYDDAKYMINTDCDMYSIADEIRAEYLAKLDSITPQVKETQAPVVQKPVEQKPTVQEPVVQEPVVQQPQQTGEVYKGESIDKYLNFGYTVEEAKKEIDEIEAHRQYTQEIGGVMKPEDTQGWGQEPVVQQPQQTGEIYKGQSIDNFTSRGYTKEEAKQLIDEYLAPEVLDTIKGVTTEDDVKGWN